MYTFCNDFHHLQVKIHPYHDLTVLRVLFFHAPIFLYGCHTWSSRGNFNCGRERLSLPCSSCCRVDWRDFLSFFSRVWVCTQKNILSGSIRENPYFDHTALITAMISCRLYVSLSGLGVGIVTLCNDFHHARVSCIHTMI